jgi:hypothetical protein
MEDYLLSVAMEKFWLIWKMAKRKTLAGPSRQFKAFPRVLYARA